MITVRNLHVRVGARVLLADASFRIAPGDRIGLVGRNGAGKTTLTKVLAGETPPASGSVSRVGSLGCLSQDSRAVDLDVTVSERMLSARGLDEAVRALRAAEHAMTSTEGQEKAMRAYARAEAEFQARGGYAAEAEAARVATGLGLTDRVLSQPLRTLSGGQRRRVELARLLFAADDTLLLDEPTNHLDADTVGWLRDFLTAYQGGLFLISHDIRLLERTVNRVFHLDADRAALDVYNVGWRSYLTQRDTDDRRRRRERTNAERKAQSLLFQADRMRGHSKTAVAAKNMARRASRMIAELEPERRAERVARIRLPEPAPCGRVPLTAEGLSKSYGSLEVFRGVDLAVDRASRIVVLGLNGAGKSTLLRILSGYERPDTGAVGAGHGLRLGYYAQEHETLDPAITVGETMRRSAPQLTEGEARTVLGSFLFRGDDADKPVSVLSGGEKTRLALAGLVCSGSNVLLLDEPTNNLDPASREEILRAIDTYRGAIVLVTHDEDAVRALRPHRVLMLPDGIEELWSDGHGELIALA
jgi:ATPase subunit of ABC transporter with duplicated ATPase domains